MYKMVHINISKIFVVPSMTYMHKMGHINIGHEIFVHPSMTYMYKMLHINIGHKIFVDPSLTNMYKKSNDLNPSQCSENHHL